jgi:hypothetical protein
MKEEIKKIMDIEKIFELLEQENCNPKYLDIDDVGFSRWIEFETKYQKCWIEWYSNVSTLRVGDKWGIRIPFTHIQVKTTSPSNKRCFEFTHKDITKNFGLADCDVDLTIEKLDWQALPSIQSLTTK